MNNVGLGHSIYMSEYKYTPMGRGERALSTRIQGDAPAGFESPISNTEDKSDSDRSNKLLRKSFKSVKQMAQYMFLLMKKSIDIKEQAKNGHLNTEDQKRLEHVLSEIEDMANEERPPVSTSSISVIV